METRSGCDFFEGGWGRNEVKPPAIREQWLQSIQNLAKIDREHTDRWGLGYASSPATRRWP